MNIPTNATACPVSALILIVCLVHLAFPGSANAQSPGRFTPGTKRLVQDRASGQWLAYHDPVLGSITSAGAAEGNALTVISEDEGITLRNQSLGLEFQLPTPLDRWNVFAYDEPRTVTSNYARNVESQVLDLENGVREEWSVTPNYGSFYGFQWHTQGIAITANGHWVQTQSDDLYGVLQSIDPVTERNRSLLEFSSYHMGTQVPDPHPSGIQACGNVVAVYVGNKFPGDTPDVRFFEVSRSGGLTPLDHLTFSGEILTLVRGGNGVGFTHVKDVGYFAFLKQGHGLLKFRRDLKRGSPDWVTIPHSGTVIGAESGVNLVMEEGSGSMYLLSLGTDEAVVDQPHKFSLRVISPPDPGHAAVTDYWKAVSRGEEVPEIKVIRSFSLPRPPLTFGWDDSIEAQFRWGGNAHVNDVGRLEFLQAPRDFLTEGFAETASQFPYRVTRSRSGNAVDPVTRGRITRIKCITETDDGPGSDEVYLISNSYKDGVRGNVDAGEAWAVDFTIESSSTVGNHVHLMEDDSGATFGPRPEKIGEVFIPAAQHALPGTHVHTATLVGDGGEYQVTYEITSPLRPQYRISPEKITTSVNAGKTTIRIDEAGSWWNGNAAWTAASDRDWLTVSPASGTGAGTVELTYAANPGETTRVGTVAIGDQLLRVEQSGTQELVVTNLLDISGFPGSLRQVIAEALPGQTIVFDPTLSGGTISLVFGQLQVNKDLTIDATALPGGLTIRQTTENSRVMLVSGATANLSGLTLTGGTKLDFNSSGFGKGGAIFLNRGDLSISQCTLLGNSAYYGGAIHNAGGRMLHVSDSTFFGNSGLIAGGAIHSEDIDLLGLPAVTAVSISSSTISGNQAGTGGGGGVSHQQASVPLLLGNVIIAGNTTPEGSAPDVLGSINADAGVNLIGDPDGTIGMRQTDLTGDPRLAPLNYWGGPTQAMPPLPGSPVLDAAVLPLVSPFLSSRDQHGVARTPGSLVELGSLEAFAFSSVPLMDTDNDGIDDRLESAYPQLTVGVDDSSLDSDDDGTPDWQELFNMTDPDDPKDQFRIFSVDKISTPGSDQSILSIEFRSFPGLRYDFESASASLEFRAILNSAMTASGPSETVSVSLPPGHQFLRVRQRAD